MRRTLAFALISLALPAMQVIGFLLPAYEVSARPVASPPFTADCRIVFEGSRATAVCQNPNAWPDRVRLHLECERWWDIDTDTGPTDVDPALTRELTGRCWKEVRGAWISHESPDRSSADT